LAHVGVLKGLQDAGFPKPSLVAGTSMGAIVGGLYACGMTPDEMVRFVLEEFNIADYLDSFVFRISGPVGKVFQTGQALASLAASTGIDSGQRALDLLEKLSRGKNFDETLIPFRCNALDLLSGREVVFKSGSVAKAIRASMSIPVFFQPFTENGMCLVDGGLIDNMPVSIARDEGYRHILAVNVNKFAPVEAKDLKNGPQIIYRSIESILNAFKISKIPQTEMVVDVTNDATPFSFYRKKEFIELGRRAVEQNMESFREFFRPRLGARHRFM